MTKSRVPFWFCSFAWLGMAGCTSVRPKDEGLETQMDPSVIIFVPGYYGTSLIEKDSETLRHLSLKTALFGGPSLALNASLLGLEAAEVLPGGVLEKVTLIPGLFSVDIYGETMDFLRESFPGRVVFYSYDWRESIVSAAQGLAALVSEVRKRGASRVAIVAHSNGGMVATYFLRYGNQDLETAKEDWSGLKQVNAVVMGGVPFRGTVTPFYNMIHGLSFVWEKTPLNGSAFSTFPSAFELLPPGESHPFVNKEMKSLGDAVSNPDHWERQRWGFFKEVPSQEIRGARRDYLTRQFRRRLLFSQKFLNPQSVNPQKPVPALIVLGQGMRSLNQMRWTASTLSDSGKWEANKESLYVDGDGTLTADSAQPTEALRKALQFKLLKDNLEHTAIFKASHVQDEVRSFLVQQGF